MATNELCVFILLPLPTHICVNNLCSEVHFNTAFIGDRSYIINAHFLLVEECSYILKFMGSRIFYTTKKATNCHSTIPLLTVFSARRSRVILKNGIFNYIQPLLIKGQLPSHPFDVSVLQLLEFKKTAGELHCKIFRRRCCKKVFSNG